MSDSYRKFYEEAGKYYPENEIVYSTLSGLIRKKWVINMMKSMPSGNLLDCGCNVGTLSRDWRQGDIFGIDISFFVLKRGRKKSTKINFIQGDIREIKFIKSDTIDNAIACEVIEHLDRPIDFLKGLYHIMKNGGYVLITAPNYSHFRPRLIKLGLIKSFGIVEGTDGDLYLHTAYKPRELAEMAKRVGFRVIQEGSFEFELRGWVKPLTWIREVFGLIRERFFPLSKLDFLFCRLIDRLELNLFFILETFSLTKLIKIFFREGRRTYILVKK